MIGIKPNEFWDITMKELMICIEAYELKHYGIENGKKINPNDDPNFGSPQWRKEWQENFNKPKRLFN